MIGIVVFAFGLEATEPSISNAVLAEIAIDISRDSELHGEWPVIAAQWECALAIPNCPKVIGPTLGSYLSSDDVVHEAASFFRSKGIKNVIAVAKPGPHLWLCRRLLRKQGFHVDRYPIGAVPYSPTSLQVWTRSAGAFYRHCFKRYRGHQPEVIITIQMRELAKSATR